LCIFISGFVILRYLIGRILHQYEDKGLDQSYHLADIVKLYSQSLSSIRIADKKDHYYDKIEQLSSRALRLRMKSQMLANWDRLSVYALLIGAMLVLQTASMFGVIPGLIAFIPYLLVIYRLTNAFNQFSSLINEVIALEPKVKAVQKIYFIPEEKLERTDGLSPTTAIESVSVRDVSFGYQGGGLLFSKLNLSFHKGKKYLLIGDSGLGKSTIVKLLFGLYEVHQGSIALNTADGSRFEYADLSLDFIRSQYLYIHQSEIIVSETVREYVAAGDGTSQECIWEILDSVGMCNVVENFSGGIDETIGVNGTMLSGGQFQLLQLARALLSDKAVIILDEVSNSLDSSRRIMFQKLISEKAKHGHIIIEISHSSEGLAYADVVYNLPST
ncbi:ABC transporter ATP-binding protein/permease, partial [Burkholderiales bacterium]|nr:ABC transporter ATP-binding protein/permease [Burkholderiales bacterium]